MSSKKRNHKNVLAAMLADLTGFPVESLSDMPVLLCKGSGEVLAEGCTAILEYGDTRIRLDMGRQILCVDGECLSMADFHRNCLTIRGSIRSIGWEA